jgi:aspartyl protease family protein
MDSQDIGRLTYLVLILIAVAGWVMVEYRGRMGFAMRTAMAWALIFGGVAAGYALWSDLRFDAAPAQIMTEDGRVEIPRAGDGHYYMTLDMGGTPVQFMADTGASNVVLTKDDARRIGINPDELLFLGEAQTANGIVRTARTNVQDVSFGPFADTELTVWVNDGDLDISLLGMDYLGRYRIEIDGNTMVLSR